MNLCLQVLDGILAHDGEIPCSQYEPHYGKTWEVFNEEYRNCNDVENYSKRIVPMTLEGCVVRISDIIAYIGRDIDDAITLGVIEGIEDIPPEITKILGESNKEIIHNLVMDLIKNSYGKDHLVFTPEVFEALKRLLKFNQEHIYSDPRINRETPKLETMFHKLYAHYLDCLKRSARGSPIYGFRDGFDRVYLENTSNERIVIDYIAGMTDDFFNNQYKELVIPRAYGYSI